MSLCVAIMNKLNEWLTEHDNLVRWEEKLTAGGKRIPITELVTNANGHVMSDDMDNIQIGCFERT